MSSVTDGNPITYTSTRQHPYLHGYANKIVNDLNKMLRLYTGVYIRLYNLDRTTQRCTNCTDSLTGAVLLTNCPVCHGTGFTQGYVSCGDFWSWVNIKPYLNTADDLGNTDNINADRTIFYLVGTPLLKDSAVIITKDTKDVYKIIDDQAEVTAINGNVVLQTAQVSRVTYGSMEYNLIDW